MNSYKIAVGSDLGGVKNIELTWDELKEKLTTHKQAERKGGEFFLAGHFKGSRRVEEEMLFRSLLTIDIDHPEMSLADLEYQLTMNIDTAYIAYSTFQHSPVSPRIRLVIPLSAPVSPAQYRTLSRSFCDELGVKVDSASFVPNQSMLLPSCPDLTVAWFDVGDGEPLAVRSLVSVKESDELDLMSLIESTPLDLSADEIDAYLLAYPAQDKEYDEWLEVGAALNHQFSGDDNGYHKWVKWSALSDKHDEKTMRAKWKSFGRVTRTGKNITFATVIHRVKENGGIAENHSLMETLCEEAGAVSTMPEYSEFKKKLQSMNELILPQDLRGMVAARLADKFGKTQGIGKAEIKKALSPAKKEKSGDIKSPDWLEPWYYVEKTCEFANSLLNYTIKREAFNAKYDRESECQMFEKPASVVALNDFKIPLVVDQMFWPGAGVTFSYEGKQMLNSYHCSGVEPCGEIDADGQRVIDMFMDHLRFTLSDEREQRILLDWMAYVIQNPGKRVNWALLLQGAQGVGKSYFGNVMQMILGELVRNLEPTAISGRFTGWAHGALVVVVEEIRISGANRYETLDRMKPFITNKTVQIEEKGRDHRTVPNFTSYFMLTNHKDAIPLADGDRRYCVLFSRVQSEDQLFDELGGKVGAQNHFKKLFAETERRSDAMARFFLDYQISEEFSAEGRAPDTNAKQSMIDVNVSPARMLLESAIDEHQCRVINDEIIDITWLNELCESSETELPKTNAMSAILLELGFVQIKDRRTKINGKYHYVWYKEKKELNDTLTKAKVRNFFDKDEAPF
jgi:hypothetical protein